MNSRFVTTNQLSFGLFWVIGWLGIQLTWFKVVVAGAIAIMITGYNYHLASLGILVWMIIDIFDGVLFRMAPVVFQEDYGLQRRVADALADRACVCLVLSAAIKAADLPVYIYGVEMVREVVLISIIGRSWVRRHPILGPNNVSRAAGFSTGLATMAWLVSQPEIAITCITLTGVLGAVGLWKYHKTSIKG